MAPIKFEEDIKQRMEQRHIQPSESSWEVLSKKLEAETKRKKLPVFWWLGIAASIVGVLLVSSFFFKASEINETNLKTVATENNEAQVSPASEAKTTNFNKAQQQPILNTSVKASEVAEIEKSKLPKEDTTTKSVSQQPIRQPSEEKLAMNQPTTKENETHKALQQTGEEASQTKLVADVDHEKALSEAFSENEIERLLKQAENDILKHRTLPTSTKTVNANSLLQDVEADLEHSFRAKVFEALKTSYETVKTAVAQRND